LRQAETSDAMGKFCLVCLYWRCQSEWMGTAVYMKEFRAEAAATALPFGLLAAEAARRLSLSKRVLDIRQSTWQICRIDRTPMPGKHQ
jgi:hypothetical protein